MTEFFRGFPQYLWLSDVGTWYQNSIVDNFNTNSFNSMHLLGFVHVAVFKFSYFCAIRIVMNPLKTVKFILPFSTTCFGPKGHHQIEDKNKRICVTQAHSLIWN